MLTLVTIPKPFSDAADIAQRNAIGSWRSVFPDAQIILCGRDAGVETAAADFACEHWPDIATTGHGTPLVSSAFAHAERTARHRLIGFLNADIVVCGDLRSALQSVRTRRFLALSQRWDLDVERRIDFSNPNWEGGLREDLRTKGTLHPPAGSDLFVFPGSIPWQMPPFAVGRPGWDNWLIYRARVVVGTVIDLTPSVTLVHQNHDYRHVPSGRDQLRGWEGPEADKNRMLIGDAAHLFSLTDATHVLRGGRVVPDLSRARMEQRMSRQPVVDLSRSLWAKARRRLLRRLMRGAGLETGAPRQRLIYACSR